MVCGVSCVGEDCTVDLSIYLGRRGDQKAALVPVMGTWLRRFAPAAAVSVAGAGAIGAVHGHVLWRRGTLALLV